MRKLILFVIIAALITIFMPKFTEAAVPADFKDWGKGPKWPAWLDSVKTDKETVAKAIEYGIYQGYPDKTLRLTDTITRAEFATALSRVLETGTENGAGAEWYKPHVDALVDMEIITNTGGNWNAPITRLEMGQWMGRAVMQNQNRERFRFREIHFEDVQDPDVDIAAMARIINGVGEGKFNPGGKAQRVEAALMLMRYIEPPGLEEGQTGTAPSVSPADDSQAREIIPTPGGGWTDTATAHEPDWSKVPTWEKDGKLHYDGKVFDTWEEMEEYRSKQESQ